MSGGRDPASVQVRLPPLPLPLRVGNYERGATGADRGALVLAARSPGSDAAGYISPLLQKYD
ncbi:MAG: hypothetical protein WAW37_06000 [Syntrophobacteraceae bacterium]